MAYRVICKVCGTESSVPQGRGARMSDFRCACGGELRRLGRSELSRPTPRYSIEAIQALHGRIFAMLEPAERDVLEFYRAEGRKFGVEIRFGEIGADDAAAISTAPSRQAADALRQRTNATIEVATQIAQG